MHLPWACSCSGKIQGAWCPGLRCGIASELKRRPPSGYIPDMAGAGGEVISGVFHADQARAGMSPSQTSEGRKEAGTEPGCAQPWLSHTAVQHILVPILRGSRVAKGIGVRGGCGCNQTSPHLNLSGRVAVDHS